MRNAHILICDDEPDLREMVGEYLEKRGYTVQLASDGQMLDALIAETERVDVVLLDINMPGEDGLSILRRLRDQHDFAVLMLTAANETIDKVLGLEMGADDYLAKPVDLREVDARIRAVLRRAAHRATPLPEGQTPARIGFGRFEMDLDAAKLFDKEGTEVPLTAMEFRLLKVFVKNRGRVLNRDQLLELAHDRGWDPYDRSIDIRVSRLRRKIEVEPSKPQLIRTVRGIGYVFDPTG
ncbi:response regulator [Dinoroseobacter sp. S76]|uniref:response regulator n=1 Tax=Dinoroseobacter sp. S76 TaxID=3415124 RepID=UPI003C7AED9C